MISLMVGEHPTPSITSSHQSHPNAERYRDVPAKTLRDNGRSKFAKIQAFPDPLWPPGAIVWPRHGCLLIGTLEWHALDWCQSSLLSAILTLFYLKHPSPPPRDCPGLSTGKGTLRPSNASSPPFFFPLLLFVWSLEGHCTRLARWQIRSSRYSCALNLNP